MDKWEYCEVFEQFRGFRGDDEYVVVTISPDGFTHELVQKLEDIGLSETAYHDWKKQTGYRKPSKWAFLYESLVCLLLEEGWEYFSGGQGDSLSTLTHMFHPCIAEARGDSRLVLTFRRRIEDT